MKLEICANSFESALVAQVAGAHRIELCQELSLGGITPSHGLLEKVVSELEIPVFVLIRPRSGDFTYSQSEFDVMLRDIAFAKALGVQGIVSGILNTNFTIDTERTKRLMGDSGELPFVFHRAFDWTPNAEDALETLIDLGVKRVLTSGQQSSAVIGFQTLKQLLKIADGRIEILPGGGISELNVMDFKNANFKEVHGSLSRAIQGKRHPLKMSDNKTINQGWLRVSDQTFIQDLISKIQ